MDKGRIAARRCTIAPPRGHECFLTTKGVEARVGLERQLSRYGTFAVFMLCASVKFLVSRKDSMMRCLMAAKGVDVPRCLKSECEGDRSHEGSTHRFLSFERQHGGVLGLVSARVRERLVYS